MIDYKPPATAPEAIMRLTKAIKRPSARVSPLYRLVHVDDLAGAKTFLEHQRDKIAGLERRLTRKLEAIAMEARQGGDGATRLHPKDDSATPKGGRP